MIPFLDLASDFADVEADARARIDGVLRRQQFVLGPETAALEGALRDRLGCAAAVAVSSGTEALSLSLLALGVGAGDAVLLPAFTFFATAGAVARAGAQPVFCDIDPKSFLGEAEQMRAAVERQFRQDADAYLHRGTGAKLAAIIPVHLYGRACRMAAIAELARELGAKVVEDAAQAIDCRIGGKSVGRFGDTGCFSFYPTKNLGGPGDGGLVVCENLALAERLRKLRTHGGEHGGYEHQEVGINARMSEMVAAVLGAKLVRLEAWTQRRRELAAMYLDQLGAAAERGLLELPGVGDEAANVWHQFTVRIGNGRRDRVQAMLEERGIATRVFYPLPLHRQPCFAGLGGKAGDLPVAELAAGEVLCLPIHPSLGEEDVGVVAAALTESLETVSS